MKTKRLKGCPSNIINFQKKKSNLCDSCINACRRSDKINLKSATICSVHFTADCFAIPLRNKLLNYTYKNLRDLKCDGVPTINIPRSIIENKVALERTMRIKRKTRTDLINSILIDKQDTESIITTENKNENVGNDSGEINILKEEILKLEKENVGLKINK